MGGDGGNAGLGVGGTAGATHGFEVVVVDMMSYNIYMKRNVFGWLMTILLGLSLAMPGKVSADVLFRTGDILDVRNVTAGQTGWSKSTEAESLDEVEFRVMVENIGTIESPDVNVRAGFALDPGNSLKNRIYVGVWSAPAATGTVEVKVDDDTQQKLTYVAGKSVKYGGGCDGCNITDNIARAQGAYVGKVKPGEKIEVRFRAQVTDRQTALTPVNSTPTPTPKPATDSAVAKTAPKTGFGDPLWLRTLAWIGLGTAGMGLRQFATKLGKIEA